MHVHDCFAWSPFIHAAVRNFARARRRLELPDSSPGCLVLVEPSGGRRFVSLWNDPGAVCVAGWRVERGADGRSLLFDCGGGATLLIVAGRQIVTAENLEVLAVACSREIRDSLPIRAALGAVADCGARAVVPWGFGKWLGRRGRIVRELIDALPVPFSLGDNGGRAGSLPRPPLFRLAERRGVPVLTGSDPLPLPREERRAGSYGFVLHEWRMTSRPAESLAERIGSLRGSPPSFGELNTVPGLIRAQLGLRWRRCTATPRTRAAA